MKKLIGVIAIIIILFFIVLTNKQATYHGKSNKQLNYEKATKIVCSLLLEKNGIHPTQEKLMKHLS